MAAIVSGGCVAHNSGRDGSDSGIYLLLFVGCLSLYARPLLGSRRRHYVIFGRQPVRRTPFPAI